MNAKSFEICFVCCRRSEPEVLADVGFKAIFKCLGKLYEHQRKDRDNYVDIFWENIKFCKYFNYHVSIMTLAYKITLFA